MNNGWLRLNIRTLANKPQELNQVSNFENKSIFVTRYTQAWIHSKLNFVEILLAAEFLSRFLTRTV